MSSVNPLGCRAARSGGRTRRSPAALLVLAAWLLWLALPLHAAPAPWYYWRSKVDGARVCAQTSPGPGWERDSPPYEGPGCQPRTKVIVVPKDKPLPSPGPEQPDDGTSAVPVREEHVR